MHSYFMQDKMQPITREEVMLLTIAAILFILWLLGFAIHIGSLIHVLLVIALVIFIYDLLVAHRRPL